MKFSICIINIPPKVLASYCIFSIGISNQAYLNPHSTICFPMLLSIFLFNYLFQFNGVLFQLQRLEGEAEQCSGNLTRQSRFKSQLCQLLCVISLSDCLLTHKIRITIWANHSPKHEFQNLSYFGKLLSFPNSLLLNLSQSSITKHTDIFAKIN